MRAKGVFVALALAACLPITSSGAPTASSARFTVDVTAHPINRFRIGSDDRMFGPLEFLGGLELRSSESAFGSISGFRFSDRSGGFVAVTDTGFWVFGRVLRGAMDRATGWTDVAMQPITDAGGATGEHKWNRDAESLEIEGSTAVVGFERDHRVATYDLSGAEVSAETGRIDYLVPSHELRRNAGFETIAKAPVDSHLGGALVAITEKSLDEDGDIFAAILGGPEKGVFKVARHGTFDVTDGVFLPSHDLLIVERSFNIAEGVRMRLRRIALADIRRNRIVDGEVLLEADMRYQIDNMEAVDVWTDAQGQMRIAILSDDNQSILQRNLYLEFRLTDSVAQSVSTGRSTENSRP